MPNACNSCACLTPDQFRKQLGAEHSKHMKSLQWTLSGLMTDKDKELGINLVVISPDMAVITLDGIERDSFSTRESPWEVRQRMDFIVAHYIIKGGIEFGEVRA